MKFFYLPLALLGAASVAAQGQQGIEQIIKTLPKCAVRLSFSLSLPVQRNRQILTKKYQRRDVV